MSWAAIRTIPYSIKHAFWDLMLSIERLWSDRGLRNSVLWWYVLGLTVCILSAFIVVWIEGVPQSPPAPATGNISLSTLPLFFAIGAAIGFIAGVCFPRNRAHSLFFDGALAPYRDDSVRRKLWAGLVLAFILTLLAILLTYFGVRNLAWRKLGETMFKNPGGAFAIITGLATMIGTYIAIHSIFELKYTITTFTQLIYRLADLIEDATKDERSEEGVYFLAFTPLPGWWNVGEKARKRLRDMIRHEDSKVRIACLNSEDHLAFLKLFSGKETLRMGKIEPDTINNFHKDCEELLGIVSGVEYELDATTKKRKQEECRIPPVRLKESEMPGYYFFVSSKRAIIGVPVDMPRLGNPPPTEFAGRSFRPIKVETLGFETTDRAVIELLQNEFERYTIKNK